MNITVVLLLRLAFLSERKDNIITNVAFLSEFGRKENIVPVAKHSFTSIAYRKV